MSVLDLLQGKQALVFKLYITVKLMGCMGVQKRNFIILKIDVFFHLYTAVPMSMSNGLQSS